MAKVIRIDLHTHPIEALKAKMGIRGLLDINKEVAAELVHAIKSAGLNGIAITEHNNFNQGWIASLEVMDYFNRENVLILPGEELDYKGQQILNIYIPEYVRRRTPFFKDKEWFLVLANPGFHKSYDPEDFKDIEFHAVEQENLNGEFAIAKQIAEERNIPLIKCSDAKQIDKLGYRFLEISSNLR